MKDLLRISDLSSVDLRLLLDRAAEVARDPTSHSGLMNGEIVVLFFETPSTRTRLSFERAISMLGGRTVFVSPSELQLSRGETIEDTAKTASRYARAWIMRAERHAHVERFARTATLHVVNGLTDLHHPCQSLADLFTIERHFGRLAGIRAAWVGPLNSVAMSFAEAAALAGLHLRVATPRPADDVGEALMQAREAARTNGGSLEVFDDPRTAVTGADVVYTDVWSRQPLERFRVDGELMRRAAPNAVFLHSLPCHRGEEVTADVIDGPASLVFDQAGNRLHTAVALLDALLRSELSGRPI